PWPTATTAARTPPSTTPPCAPPAAPAGSQPAASPTTSEHATLEPHDDHHGHRLRRDPRQHQPPPQRTRRRLHDRHRHRPLGRGRVEGAPRRGPHLPGPPGV